MKHSDPFISGIKQALDSEQLDAETLQQLSRARHSALDQQTSGTLSGSRFVKPALAFASVCALAIALTLSISPEEETGSMDFFESMDIITSRDELEMYENLEFYLWLDEQIKT